MKNLFAKCLSRALLIFAILTAIVPASVARAIDAASVTVSPSLIIESVTSGSSSNYTITVTNGFALDLEVDGLGQTVAGATYGVLPADDTSAYTARPWVSIDKNHLDPGTSNLTVRVNVPAGTNPGEKYAAIYMHSQGSTQGGATIISGVLIPLIFTVNQTSFITNISGQMTDLQVPTAYRGRAIDILTYFNNNGNCRITGATNNVTIRDSSQTVKWQNLSPITPSVIPSYPRIIDVKYNVGLNSGSYSVTSIITLASGAVYSRSLNFNVLDPPPIPAAPTLTSPGNGTAPGPVIDTATPAFRWNLVSGADYYQLSVSRAPYTTNDVVFSSEQLAGTSFTLPSGVLFNGEKYCWQLTVSSR